jgi:nucleotide-binding universal stress UspA family protein
MKILVPVDGSRYTKRMLAYLSAHDEWLGAQQVYTLLHVTPSVPPRAAAVLDKAVLAGYYEDEAEKVFKPIRTFFAKRSIQAQFVAKTGHAAEVICQTADKGRFDLVMLGSHGQSALANLVMGSVATKVVAGCQAPVLIVR